VLELVTAQDTDMVELEVEIGAEQRLPCRLLAVRVPEDVTAQRRERVEREAKKKGRKVRPTRLKARGWTMMVTNVDAEVLKVAEVLVLLRIRWQMEVLFKVWESEGQVDTSRREGTYSPEQKF